MASILVYPTGNSSKAVEFEKFISQTPYVPFRACILYFANKELSQMFEEILQIRVTNLFVYFFFRHTISAHYYFRLVHPEKEYLAGNEVILIN